VQSYKVGAGTPSKRGVLVVGPIPRARSYIGGVGTLIRTQLEHWQLPFPVAHLNTELWSREYGTVGKFTLRHLAAFGINSVRLGWAVIRQRPRLVHIHSSIGLGLLKDMVFASGVRWVLRRPVVLQVHFSVVDAILFSRVAILRRWQLRWLAGCCDRLALLSQNVLQDFCALLPVRSAAVLREKSIVLPNFTDIPSQATEGAPSLPINIFFIGNVGQRKGAYDLIGAARQLKRLNVAPFRVTLAGPFDSADDQQRLASMVEDSGLQEVVSFLGPVSGDAKARAFRQAHVFVLPSYGEGVPISLLEAMAYGLPVVVTKVGGIPETITSGQEGYLLPVGDTGALVGALRELVQKPTLREQMGKAARARAEKCHSIMAYFHELQSLYAGLSVSPAHD